jgi:hypothetical protein
MNPSHKQFKGSFGPEQGPPRAGLPLPSAPPQQNNCSLQVVVPVYLLREELIAITGYRQKAKQTAWLKAQKIQFRLNGFGHPIVGRTYWDALSGMPKRRTTVNTPNWGTTA